MEWGAGGHCSLPNPGWTPCLLSKTLNRSREVPETPASCDGQSGPTRGWGCASRVGRQQWECSCKTLSRREAPS